MFVEETNLSPLFRQWCPKTVGNNCRANRLAAIWEWPEIRFLRRTISGLDSIDRCPAWIGNSSRTGPDRTGSRSWRSRPRCSWDFDRPVRCPGSRTPTGMGHCRGKGEGCSVKWQNLYFSIYTLVEILDKYTKATWIFKIFWHLVNKATKTENVNCWYFKISF